MLATVSRESPNDSAASARVSGWFGTSAVEKGFGTSRLYDGCAGGVAVKSIANRIAWPWSAVKPMGATTDRSDIRHGRAANG
jgi:hypothetical protein